MPHNVHMIFSIGDVPPNVIWLPTEESAKKAFDEKVESCHAWLMQWIHDPMWESGDDHLDQYTVIWFRIPKTIQATLVAGYRIDTDQHPALRLPGALRQFVVKATGVSARDSETTDLTEESAVRIGLSLLEGCLD
jgi:hypothetical protein